MIRFEDSKGNLISEAGDGAIIRFHNRLIINPGLGVPLDEEESLIIFTKENFKKLQDNYDKNVDDLIMVSKEALKISEEGFDTFRLKIKSLENENKNLKRLNMELSKKINKLREEG